MFNVIEPTHYNDEQNFLVEFCALEGIKKLLIKKYVKQINVIFVCK